MTKTIVFFDLRRRLVRPPDRRPPVYRTTGSPAAGSPAARSLSRTLSFALGVARRLFQSAV
jgi:hypothetical protein